MAGWFFSRRWLVFKFAVLFGAAISLHNIIYADLEKHRTLIASSGFDSARLEVMSRLESEFELVFQRGESYARGDAAATIEAVNLALDVFWSRVGSGSNESYAQVYAEQGVDISVLADLQKALPDIELGVKSLRYGDLASYGLLADIWHRLKDRVAAFNEAAYAARVKKLQDSSQAEFQMFDALRTYQHGVSLIGLCLLALFFGELVWASRIASNLRGKSDEATRLANTDHLTGLHNRRAFDAELLARLAGSSHQTFTMLLIDVDHFSTVNRSLGHATGDRILVEIAHRIRESAAIAHVSRLAGDEFAVLINTNAAAATIAATNIAQHIGKAIDLGDRLYRPTVSISICEHSEKHSADPETMMLRANSAVRQAKSLGGSRCILFDEAMLGDVNERKLIEADLPRAISDGAIEIAVQPKVLVSDGSLCGLEALARWQHKDMGWVSPEKFCTIADENGMSSQLGLAIADRAFEVASALKKAGKGVPLSINVSPAFASHPAFVGNMTRLMALHDIVPSDVELEVTEEAMLSDFDIIRRNLSELHRAGTRIAIDDFGKGYSNINRLTTLAADCIKVDKAAVDNIVEDTRARAIVKSIISLARDLNIEVVVEGVETREQLELLATLGVEKVQGYLISRPLPPLKLMGWIADHERPAGTSARAVA